MSRLDILKAYVQKTKESFETMIEAAHHARDSAISDEVKTQDKYDTQGTELGYLAGAQAERAAQLKESLGRLQLLEKNFDPRLNHIAETALFWLENQESGSKKLYMLLPIEGGIKIRVQTNEVSSLSSSSALGQELLGKSAGDEFETEINERGFSYRVAEIIN